MKLRENAMIETHYWSLMKACSWRVWATLTTIVISYFVTGSFTYAISIGSIEVVAKIFLYYCHERVWAYNGMRKQKIETTDPI